MPNSIPPFEDSPKFSSTFNHTFPSTELDKISGRGIVENHRIERTQERSVFDGLPGFSGPREDHLAGACESCRIAETEELDPFRPLFGSSERISECESDRAETDALLARIAEREEREKEQRERQGIPEFGSTRKFSSI